MTEKKIIFFDIDGTISHEGKVPSDKTIEGIKQLQKNGHLACICTGRSKAMIEDQLTDIGFDGIVAACGRYVEFQGEVLLDEEIQGDIKKQTVDFIKEYNISCFLEGTKKRYFHNLEGNKLFKKLTEFIEKDIESGRGKALIEEDIDDLKFNKGSIAENDDSSGEMFKKKMHEYYNYIEHPMGLFEFVPKGSDKSTGIQELIEKIGISRENTYAFGDSNNDLDMLQYVNISVAMGNSNEEVFKVSKYRTDTVWNEGVFKGLKMLNLI